jgi:Tfp pilus assembly protein PilV
VGLVEVMIALSILLLSALAVSSLQTVGLLSATSSSVHFSIDHLSSEILETLRLRSVEANDGLLNLDSDEEDLSGVHPEVLSWLQRIEESIPTGEGSISCGSNVCDVSISWVEEIDGSRNRLFFRSSTPL